jgi:hypothetical protein
MSQRTNLKEKSPCKNGKGKRELTLEEFQSSVEAWKGDEKKAREYWTRRGIKLPC